MTLVNDDNRFKTKTTEKVSQDNGENRFSWAELGQVQPNYARSGLHAGQVRSSKAKPD